ncbi:MAG: carbohydrate ABC transporter permease [Ruminococcaceae bacterium]|nr:carbohydrate ABC transporter permease [Oscillospiraceae bacterium]
MNAQNIENKPKVRKETKNKIRVDFERAPLKERLKAKFLSLYFLKRVIWYIFRLILLIGIAYIVLFPFFSKIAGSFMGPDDFVDVTVRLIPKNFSVDMYKAIWTENHYLEAFGNTLLLSASTALIQTFICCFVAYGLAKFKFKGNGLVFLAVIFSLTIPHQTLQLSLFMKFLDFDILGIVQFLNGGGIELFGNTFLEGVVDIIPDTEEWTKVFQDGYGMTLTNTYWPLIIMSLCGLAFKNGLYIFMLRQFFRGVPDELEESAYIDGSGVMHTFFTIILPLSVPMMITVFLFAFSWQWTDDFYTGLFFTTNTETILMPDIIDVPASLSKDYAGQNLYYAAIRNTCGLMLIAPLIVMYLFCQKYLVQGIERSGLTAD